MIAYWVNYRSDIIKKISINDLTSRDYIAIYIDDEEISINIIITRLGNIVQNHQTIINNYNSDIDYLYNQFLKPYFDNSIEYSCRVRTYNNKEEITFVSN